jgi:hypothetical protein
MADVFAREGNDFQGSFASDGAKVIFASGATAAGEFLGVGMLTQQLSVQYSQAVTRLYEIGTNFTFLVAGRTQGQVTLARVLGPRSVQLSFYTKYGNVCNAATNNVNFETETGCQKGLGAGPTPSGGLATGHKFGVHNAVITSLGITVNAQDMMINEQITMMFVQMTSGGL